MSKERLKYIFTPVYPHPKTLKDTGKIMISVLSAIAEIERENIRIQTMKSTTA